MPDQTNQSKVKFETTFDGIAVKRNGDVHLKFRVPQNQLTYAVRSLAFIDHYIQCGVAYDDENQGAQRIKVGRIAFYAMRIDRHGEAVVDFESSLNALKSTIEEIRSLVNKSVFLYLVYGA